MNKHSTVSPELTKEIAYKALQKFFDEKPFVLFSSGASCAIDSEFSMNALKDFLKEEMDQAGLCPRQKKEWDSVLDDLENNEEFELAMNRIQNEDLLKLVIEKTAEKIKNADHKYRNDILLGKKKWPAIDLLQRLMETVPGKDTALHVATPNYDLLAEYAFSHKNMPYITGFFGGVVKNRDWEQASRQITYGEFRDNKGKRQKITCQKKHIRLYKVHGSINVFRHNNKLIETDVWDKAPEGVERVMITPGGFKHEQLQDLRNELLHEYDEAIKQHRFFIFLGFGFNDTQLYNNFFKQKLENQECSALIITKDSNKRIKDILEKCKNLWLVCRHETKNGTLICNQQYKDGLELEEELWKFDNFTEKILGG